MIDHATLIPLLLAFVAVVSLIVLIAVVRLNSVLSIILASLFLAIASGLPPHTVIKSFEAGVGATLGHIALVVALGTMLGKMLAESGGADQIAATMLRIFGAKHIVWAMMVIGLIVGLPTFFEVGFVLLVPIAFNVARRTNSSMLLVGLPMLTGLSVVHGLVPPHPAALLAATMYRADIGHTIGFALLIGIPTAILAGPVFTLLIHRHIKLPADNPIANQFVTQDPNRKLPGFGTTLATILLPVGLMLIGGWADTISAPGQTLNEVIHFIGNDVVALLVGVLFSFITLGKLRGFNRDTILHFSNDCLAPTAVILLLIGAGGGFARILQDTNVSKAIISVTSHYHLSLLVMAWVIAALMRVATGSATVAMTTAAGIVAPIALQTPGVHPELLAIATGAGSLTLSHVNDAGFWLVKEYFNMSVGQTIKSWTVCETLISIFGLLFAVTLAAFL